MRLQQRIALSIALSFAVSAIIFLLLSTLTMTKEKIEKLPLQTKPFDFIRHKEESELNTKDRRRVKPPVQKASPLLPKVNISKELPKADLTMQKIDLPKLSLNSAFKGDLLVGANVGSLSMEVIPLVRIAPIYPSRALRMRQEGSVTLSFLINPDGTVRNVTVKDASPKHIFDEAAVRAIKKWKFKPKLEQGKAVSQQGEQTIVFTLGGKQ